MMSKYVVGDAFGNPFKVGERIVTPSGKIGCVSSVRSKKITITWDNDLSGEYTPKELQEWKYTKLGEDIPQAVIIGGFEEGKVYLHSNGRKVKIAKLYKSTKKADVYFQGEVDKQKILVSELLSENSSKNICNSHNLTSAQESAQVSPSQVCSLDSTLSESPKLMNTAVASLLSDIQTLTTTATCEKSPNVQNADLATTCTQEESILSQLPHPAPHFQQKGNGSEQTTSETVSQQSLTLLNNCNQNLQPLKMYPVCSTAYTDRETTNSILDTSWNAFSPSGMMRNGLLSEADTLALPSLESEYCWLRSPGALSSTGKGRPPGQTKQEAELKRLGLINKGEVLNPAILCQWYEIPESWLDPLECRAATELLEINAQQQEIFSILESPPSPCSESSISTHYVENQPQEQSILCPSCGLQHIYLSGGCGICGLEPMQCTPQIGQQVRITKTRTKNLEGWIGYKATVTAINNETIGVLAGDGKEKKHLTLKHGWYEVIPENFLEENGNGSFPAQKLKPSKQKGCLYPYLENKKLKDGTIASYPRVVGHRDPDNPTHWRWGYKWEEKIDDEWKGRSIGVPIGAIPMIKLMQKEGASLEEIIGFIKRSKPKKS